MKNRISILGLVLFLMGCYTTMGSQPAAGDGNTASAANDTQTELRELEEFEGINLSGRFESSIEPSEEFAIRISGADTDNVITEVKDGVLYVEQKSRTRWFSSPPRIDLVIETPADVERLRISGANQAHLVNGTGLETLHLSGSTKLLADDIDTEYLEITGSGSSRIEANGFADELNIQLSGSSRMHAGHLRSELATIRSSGVSRLDVYVEEELYVRSSGTSGVRYGGSPSKVETKTSGSSSVSSLDEVSRQD